MDTDINTFNVPKVDLDAPLTVPITESTDYETGMTPKNKFVYISGIILFFGIVLSVSGILFYYLTYFKNDAVDKSLVIVEKQTDSEPVKNFRKENFTFEILNGSGVSGVAGKASDSLTKLGYKVVRTGNTTTTTGNKLFLDKSASEFSKEILNDLIVFNVASVSGLLTDSSVSARLVIGK